MPLQSATCLGSLFSASKKPLSLASASAAASASSAVPGLHVALDAITPSEEAAMLRAVDESSAGWTTRRTRNTKNYGPYYLYKERDTPEGRFRYTDGRVQHTPLPAFLYDTVLPVVARAHPWLAGWEPNQLHVAFYRRAADGRIRMHNDNKMGELGPYIVGMCMLSDCAMTFVRPRDGRKRVVQLPRYCIYVMSGEAHFEWRHGILSGQTPSNRVSFTLREVRRLAVEDGAKVHKSHHVPTERSIQLQRERDEQRARGERPEPVSFSLEDLLTSA